jgi:hypothetical protein
VFVHANETMPLMATSDISSTMTQAGELAASKTSSTATHAVEIAAHEDDDNDVDTFAMLWPRFEKSHGDLMKYSLLPMSALAERGRLPRKLGLAGWSHAARMLESLRLLNYSLCATERASPGLQKCAPACYRRVRVCHLVGRNFNDSYAGMQTLDAAYGFANLVASEPALSAVPGALQVVFLERIGRRFLTNTAELVRACTGQLVGGHVLSCRAVRLVELSPREVIEAMRQADVTVAMCAPRSCAACRIARCTHRILLRPRALAPVGRSRGSSRCLTLSRLVELAVR